MSNRSQGLTRRGLLAGTAAAGLVPWACTLADEQSYLQAFFEASYQRQLANSPQLQTSLGLATGKDRWDRPGQEAARETQGALQAELAAADGFDRNALSPSDRLSLDVFRFATRRQLAILDWRDHTLPISHMRGIHRTIPQTLMSNHTIANEEDARAYISRLEGVEPLLLELTGEMERRAALGTRVPLFAREGVIATFENFGGGALAAGEGENVIRADFRRKIGEAGFSGEVQRALLADADAALAGPFRRGVDAVTGYLRNTAGEAPEESGAWTLPGGQDFYRAALEIETTLPVTADEIHETGLSETARLHTALRAKMAELGFAGDLQDFFAHLRDHPGFYFSNDDAGREAYLAEARAVLDEMYARLDGLFGRLPRAALEVRRVEPWLERSAGIAGYFPPSADGSRPGVFLVNLYDMSRLPRYQLQALAYHEGVPGHHLEAAIARELEHLPAFRRTSGYTAFSEGWALYAEEIPEELGLYRDPWQQVGKLTMELMRAGRLVADSGLHAKGWTRAQAAAWLEANTADSSDVISGAVNRYAVIPGQAVAYAAGKIAVMEMRSGAQARLGTRFDLSAFHDALLGEGPLPLPILRQQIEQWTATQ
ncbi:DUF885 domain-containing protein [Glycocaulis sp.]|uniref:DUF885 domain-containing protein n=1 Tax=Glycocaulis sp. TaxID=1969725 RepID=UPI003D1D9976